MRPQQQKIADITLAGVIRLIREIAVVGVFSYLSVMLLSGDLRLDFGSLSPTELVSILLAFFSIALSVAFYFAATGQSNQFYDNVNRFTKDTSELLGRLDEQVKGIGGKQSELKDSMDKYYERERPKAAQAASEAAQEEVKEAERTLSMLVSELLDKSNLTQPERADFEAKLKEKDAELSTLRERVGRISTSRESQVRRYVRMMINQIGLENAIKLSIDDLALEVVRLGVRPFRRDMLSLGFTKTEDPRSSTDITEAGRALIASALEQVLGSEG